MLLRKSPSFSDHIKHIWNLNRDRLRQQRRMRQFMQNAKGWPPFCTAGVVYNGPTTLVFSEHPYALESELLLACQAEAGGCKCLLAGTEMSIRYWRAMGFPPERLILWNSYMERFLHEAENTAEAVMLENPDYEQLMNFEFKGVNLGRHALSAVGRKHFKAVFDPQEPEIRSSIVTFFQRSIQKTLAARALFKEHGILQVLMNEPNYDNIGISRSIVLAGGSYIQFCQPFEESAFVLKRYRSDNGCVHPISLSKQSWNALLERNEKDLDVEIQKIFDVKYGGKNELSRRIGLDSPHMSKEAVIAKIALNPMRRTAVIFSHVLWDANMFWGTDLFVGGSEEWLIETIRLAMQNPDVNWLVKVHPANVWKMRAAGKEIVYNDVMAIEKKLGPMPSHVRIILPEDNINPWSLFKVTDVGFTIRGTIGMELPLLGIPVVTAGTGRYDRHGFTIDPQTIEEYTRIVETVQDLPRLGLEQIDRAKRFFWGISNPRAWRSDLFSVISKYGSHEFCVRLNPWSNSSAADQALWNFFSDGLSEDYVYYG